MNIFAQNKKLIIIIASINVNTNKISITGFSMGAVGTWDMVQKYPTFFSAVAPICGYENTTVPENFNSPVWVFYGTDSGDGTRNWATKITNNINKLHPNKAKKL